MSGIGLRQIKVLIGNTKMHETGVAWSILETAKREAARNGGELARVGVRLGEMSGVVEEALRFAFEALRDDAGVAGAELEVERVAVEASCPECGCSQRPEGDLILWCPSCGAAMRITSGEQMELAWIELREGASPAAAAGEAVQQA